MTCAWVPLGELATRLTYSDERKLVATARTVIDDLTADPAELAKFSELAHRWWDVESEFKPLHQINPLRLDWIERGAPARMDREGFGSLVLDGMLRYQLDGTAEREMGPGGVRISIAVPMRRLVEDDAAPGFA